MRRTILFFLLIFFCVLANAQSDTIRYVRPAQYGGAYSNDGRSWAKAKDNLQDAINDLRTYLTRNGLHGGTIFVAAGTYEPSEGVEGGANGQLSTSFIIYEGIHIFGGFNPVHPEGDPNDRVLMSDDRKDTIKIGSLAAGDTTAIRWQMKYPSILSGNHNHNAEGTFRWNPNRKRYDTRFPGNSYHVVFFASNGFINDTNHPGYADSLRYEARLDGFTVQDGNASGATDVRQGGRDHTAMGGGIYMVQHSVVENCIIQRCQAAMRGGGVYMDGGGKLVHSAVRECQTLGSGVSGGLGGGVCIDNNGEVRRSWITRNVARMGGGAAIISYPEDHPRGAASTYRRGVFDPYIVSTLVTNNTATTEAGGIYLDRGGVVNHVTVARNENDGRDISYGHTRYGRSGGVYIYGAGQVYNSVIWGNRCDANSDIQYAATIGVSIPQYVTLQVPFVGYTALNNLDITDFTGTTRLNVYSFETVNNDITRSGNFTLFRNPPADAGAGVGMRRLSIWYPFSKTSLATKAVQLQADYSTQAFSVMSIARQDFFDDYFEPISTLGAIETGIEDIDYAMVPPVNAKDCSSEAIPTIFVDPNRVFNNPADRSGASWDQPLDNISEAIEYFRRNPVKDGKFQILVKQGSVTCAGIGAYYAPEASTQSVVNLASIRMIPNLLLYGGFPSSLTGTITDGRNPKDYPTRISADIISADYNYNALHVVSFSMAHDAVLDGFQLYYGNAQNTSSEVLARGGGIVAGSVYYPQNLRVNMTDNVVRNCVIANCSGVLGAAIFAGGSYPGISGNVKASLTVENCVINNNASSTSIVHAMGDASIDMNHCTIIGNVGPLLVTSAYNDVEGKINISNSAFHGNSAVPLSDINNIDAANIPALTTGANITASGNLIDKLYRNDYQGFVRVFGFESADTLSYPTFANPIRNIGVARNTADNTVYGGTADFTPLDMNPVVNAGTYTAGTDHSAWGTDLTTQVTRDYGGAPDVGALECHQSAADNTEGGQPAYGSVIYVRDYNTYDADGNATNTDNSTEDRDGTSWARAINGNATYVAPTTFYEDAAGPLVSSSVSAAEYRYKLGLSASTPTLYAVADGNAIKNTSTQDNADDFLFLETGDASLYIYDLTRSRYVTYSSPSAGANQIVLSESNATNATWKFHANNDGSWGIIPGSLSDGNSQPGWNYYGGFNNNLGLYDISGQYSKWKLWVRASKFSDGLQYAVDKASESTSKPEVWVAEGYYTNTSGESVNMQHYAYRMAEGVNVFGGFQKDGNPSMRERDPKAHVTILQPQNIDPTDTESVLIKNSSESVARVLVQPNDFSTETKWDGFTLRYGYLHSAYRYNIGGNIAKIKTENIGNSGGAGAYLMEKGVLENCELLHNVILVDPSQENKRLAQIRETSNGGFHQAGAGVYITTTDTIHGDGGTLRNCVVAYNELLHKFSNSTNPESAWMYGAGVYQNKGIIYNTIIHDNTMRVIEGTANGDNSNTNTNEVLVGAGAFLVNGRFYNNTIVHNYAASLGKKIHNRHIVIPGVYVYNNITMYNSIVSDNSSSKDETNTKSNSTNVFDVPVCAFTLADDNVYSLDSKKVRVHYSYISIDKDNKDGKNLSKAQDNNTNIYIDSNKGVEHTPNYTSANIYDSKTYRLVSGSPCVNEGTDDISGVTIPSYDAAYADRVQDCAIDIGAYEYNGAELISPRESKEVHNYFGANGQAAQETVDVADYFVTQNGSGDASASSPQNAACATKLQRVLDAAGRYKYQHPNTHVVVRLEEISGGGYTPSRSAADNATEQSNPRSYSIIVPLGVEVEGGWPLNKNFGIDKDGKLHGRDPINNVTLLSGEYNSGSETVNVYHVVTFTDQVFGADGKPTGENLSDKVKTYYVDFDNPALNRDFDRAKLEGLYIEGGRATGISDADQRGGAAVITGYANVADCIVRNNQATGYGGAFFMMPGSIMEGCILEKNTAAYGGAVAVADSAAIGNVKDGQWAFLLSNTVYGNTASMRGGGLWFDNNARTWNSVYWNNNSAEQNDISGITTTTDQQDIINCPVNFCAVTNQTIAGNNNIQISPTNNRGARWGKDTNLRQKHDYDFFLPSRASVLVRNGMAYDVIRSLMRFLPGIDSLDIAGVSRLQYTAEDVQLCDTAYDGETLVQKYNYNVEIGARALNEGFSITIDKDHPLYRLFVAHPEHMESNLANALMESSDATYKQSGSSFANPFMRLTDALNYVVDARKNFPEISRNRRFEIFVAAGTYYPYADMMGAQQSVRNHTFVVPEEVSIIGGIDATNPKNRYCQDNKDGDKVTIASGDSIITLVGASTDSIRLKRERYDLNQNSVVEPWEMRNATVLSGFSEGSDLTVKNVYHVITSIADSTIVGYQPYMYSDNDLKVRTYNRYIESHYSRGNRAIILDGITITDGSATNYESSSVRNPNMYFRGGGIFVAGNYLNEADMKGVSDMVQGRRNIPLVISNSLFQNNQARLGGAIYSDGTVHVVGSSFVQNLAVSPTASETEDLKNVSFSGGGAIATNDTILATNTIFANNEARDGGGTIVIDEAGANKRINISVAHEVDAQNNAITVKRDANDIRAYGGVIWAGDSAAVRLINCDLVRNKAHAYASIYNCTPNTSESGPGHPHFGVNCVFWGNKVDAGQDSMLMNYNKASLIGGLYFSAYQKGKGLDVTVDPSTPDSLYQQTVIRNGYSDIWRLDELLGKANHNVIINDDNDAVDGPNFTLPSNEAGIGGYMSSADWVPSRINSLCDAGWGMIRQSTDGKFLKEQNLDLHDATDWFITGIYGFLADFYKREFHLTLLPQGDEKYMMYADQSGDEGTRNMDRISSDPLGTVTKDFIDIGVYEYQHALLHIANGEEVDELWVSDAETTGNNDGRSYDSPTSDLQRAIMTLLLSRNDHPKVIHVMQGTYSPLYEQDAGNIGFQIHTRPNPSTVSLRDSIETGHPYQATSLTIMGGYSKDIEGLRDVNLYPTVLKMNQRANASDANTAHLFYIADAEQWGTLGSISGDATEDEESKTIDTNTSAITKTSVTNGKVMPIVFDGLTFVNSYANAKHRDIDDNGSGVSSFTEGTATAGAAIYYREQFKSQEDNVPQGDNHTPEKTNEHLNHIGDVPKLTIRNCKFSQNGAQGANANTVPAVFIGRGGGKTLIYNSLFNNNTGAPIVSADTVDIVNCTFAHNGGHITMMGVGANASTLSNSLVWQDDSASEFKTQYEGIKDANMRNNAITGTDNTDEEKNNHNVGLSIENNDPMVGPNFVNVTAEGGTSLDYSLNPGMRTLNRADSTIYMRLTLPIRRGLIYDGRTVLRADTTWRYDISWGARLYGAGLDRGAYECRIDQQRVLYVIPTKTLGTMTGTSWENAYGQGQLQTAIDAAAIYAYTHPYTKNNVSRKTMAYVLVKGEANNTSVENRVSMRDGVSVYGSIPDNYLLNISADKSEIDDTLKTYLNNMLALRPGIAARSTRRSRVMGIQAVDADYSNGSLLDGFEVRSAAALSQPVLNITRPVVLSKIIVDGNTVSAKDQPAVNMQQGLMYNSLVFDNTPASGQPEMLIGKQAAVVNSTIVTNTPGLTTVSGEGLLANSITFGFDATQVNGDVNRSGNLVVDSVNTVRDIPFAPYLQEGVNPYSLPSYITGYRPYRYQLHESAHSLDHGDTFDGVLRAARTAQGSDATGAFSMLTTARDSSWIDFDKDCDLLGNNRILGERIDRGCFETWRVRSNYHLAATASNYPHEGSVVYVMDNASLSLGDDDQKTKIFGNDNLFRPAFMLFRPGASLYGNGNSVVLSYVAVERDVDANKKYILASLPFRYKVGNMLQTTVAAGGQINAVRYPLESAQAYDGSKRAEWNYRFNADNSECWVKVDTAAVLPANTGWLATLPDHKDKLTLRLVGYGDVDGDYVYTEDGSPKTVTLTQYDNRPTDASAHFTKAENMGWNTTGLPYLVSNYTLGADNSDGGNTTYPMNVPHIIYGMDENGKFATRQSWDSGVKLSMGDGFMTQTAVNGNAETVTFALPHYEPAADATGNTAAALVVGDDNDAKADELQINVSSAAKSMQYSLGSDGVKWLPMDKRLTSIYAVADGGTPLSLSSATPVETDIPVIVNGALSNGATISINDAAAFDSVSHVWLKDNETGRVVDLKEEPMMLVAGASASADSVQSHSLTLRIGGLKPDGSHSSESPAVRIYLVSRTLHVDGLRSGDVVSIYTISGQLYKRDTADSYSYSCDLHQGVYVVRTGSKGQAVAVK